MTSRNFTQEFNNFLKFVFRRTDIHTKFFIEKRQLKEGLIYQKPAASAVDQLIQLNEGRDMPMSYHDAEIIFLEYMNSNGFHFLDDFMNQRYIFEKNSLVLNDIGVDTDFVTHMEDGTRHYSI